MFRRTPEALLVVGYFLLRPIELAVMEGMSIRHVIAYGMVAPLIGILLASRHRRARFAAYIALSMEIMRTAIEGRWLHLAAAAMILLLLQAPRIRRVWPRVDPRRLPLR
jgi:hypothetical protein